MSKPTDDLTILYKFESTKAICGLCKDGLPRWIPKSIIHGEVKRDKEIEQVIEVEYWYVKKEGLNGDW